LIQNTWSKNTENSIAEFWISGELLMQLSIAYLVMNMPAPAEVFLAVEVNALISAGVDVNVFCLKRPHPQREKLVTTQQLSAVALYHFPYLFSWRLWKDIGFALRRHPAILFHIVALITRTCWRRPGLWIRSLLVIPKSFSIARVIQQQKIGIVHAAWGHYPAITGYLIKRLMPSVKFTIALGAYDRVMQHPMTVVAARYAAAILTQGEASAHLLKNHWPKCSTAISVIRRGINVDATRSWRGINEKPPGVIVSVGRLIKVKGHQHVVQAFARVHRSMPQTRLWILGEGKYRPKLVRLIERLGLADFVELPGHLAQTELFCRISQASVFVLTTESEADNLPNAVKEAMSIGIPVITTPTTGIDELVRDGVTGCIVPRADVGAIADSIIRILSDAAFATYLSRQGVQQVEKHFDIKETTRRREQLYYELANSGVDRHSRPPFVSSVEMGDRLDSGLVSRSLNR
jgi:glycosyltransferase involved in cell wall biosynthesis